MIRQSGFFFVVALVLVTATPAFAQAVSTPSQPASGNTVGTVVDISGAVIPGADITVTARDGRTSTVKTDSDGNFDAGMMAAQLRVASTGFETVNIEIAGSEPVRVILR